MFPSLKASSTDSVLPDGSGKNPLHFVSQQSSGMLMPWRLFFLCLRSCGIQILCFAPLPDSRFLWLTLLN